MAALNKKKMLGLRLTIGRRVKAGDKPAAIAGELSKKYGITASAVQKMIDGMKANKKKAAAKPKAGKKPGRPAKAGKAAPKKRGRKPGRPVGSKNRKKVGRPRGRRPGRPAAAAVAVASAPIILDAKTAEIVIATGKKRLSVASVVYQDEKALANSVRKALSVLG